MASTPKTGLRQVEVNPLAVGGIALVLALVLGYAFWFRPMQQQAKIEKEWTTPEAAATRGPGGAPKSAEAQALADKLRQQEGINRAATSRRRRGDD